MTILTVDTDGISGTYSSLSAAVAALPSTFTDNITIECVASTSVADVLTAVLTLDQDTTAGYNLYIKQADSNYVLECPGDYDIYIEGTFGRVNNVSIDISIEKTSQTANYQDIFYIFLVRDGTIEIKNSNIKYSGNTSYRSRVFNLVPRSGENCVIKIYNNFVWNIQNSPASIANSVFYTTVDEDIRVYNNTILGGYNLLYSTAGTNANFKFVNNIWSCANAVGETLLGADYNATDLAIGTGGVHDVTSVDFSGYFVDAANGDYHVTSSATDLIDAGIGPSSDSNVPTTDIDGDTRSGTTCDIGADEYVSAGGISIPVVMSHLRNQGVN